MSGLPVDGSDWLKRIAFRILFVSLFAFPALHLSAQNNPRTVEVYPLGSEKDSSAGKHSVRRATVLSSILPGAGQVYNRKIWKVPIIYAGFAGMGYLIRFNHTRYREFENALLQRYDNDPSTVDDYNGLYTDDNLRSLSDFYRRNRDFSVVGMALIYTLNIIDAHVDAHLFSFDTGDDLSLRWSPTWPLFNDGGVQPPGLALYLQF